MSSLGVRRRFAAVSLVLAGSLVALSACSGSDDPDADAAQSPSSSSSPSASPSPTPTPSATYKPASAEGPAENVPLPVMPEEAKVESKEGLIAFARYWYELVNYGYETGDVEPVKAVSGPDCTVCNGLYSTIQKGYENDDWFAGAVVSIDSIGSDYVPVESGSYQALIMFRQEPIEAYGPNGVHYGTTGEGRPFVQLMEAKYSAGNWMAHEVITIQELS